MIEVGEYVRTDKGEISKVSSVLEETLSDILGEVPGVEQEIGFCNTEPFVYGNIVKHSKNIIDLIEVGDYVNGMEVLHIENNKLYIEWSNEFDCYTGYLENKNIKTILTKELFEANCYKVKEEIC